MNKAKVSRWAAFVLGTAATTFALEGCIVQELLGTVLGGLGGLGGI